MSLTIDEACNLINELPKFTTKHSPREGREFLDELGAPDEGLRVIHVAGTNGKGSVCAYMESVLMQGGYSVGCFISPHLSDMRERIRLDGVPVSGDEFASAVDRVRSLAERRYWPTFFECLFFAAMLVFADRKCDVVILETGLGGRLDATNLVRDKLISVITSIGLDHCEYLGDACESIAAEKAGIIMAGRPVAYWDDCAGADVLDSECVRLHSVKIALSKSQISDVHRSNRGIDFCFRYKYDKFICLNVGTYALYQVENACLALSALVSIPGIGDGLSEGTIKRGISLMKWPGRMEEIRRRVFLDGAHNEPAVKAFLQTVTEDGAESRMLIFGCMSDKAYAREIELIADSGLFDEVLTVSTGSARALGAGELARGFADRGLDAHEAADVEEACRRALQASQKEGSYVYVAGSLYLIGEMRELIDDRF